MQVAAELAGVAGLAQEGNNRNSSTGFAVTSGTDGASGPTLTPTTDGQTIIAAGEVHASNTPTVGTGWTLGNANPGGTPAVIIEFRDQAAAASVTAAWTCGVNDFANAAIFSVLTEGVPDLPQASTLIPGPGLYGPGAEDLALDDYGTG